MRTLTSGGLRRLRRLRPEISWILVWAGTLVGIEALGRRASSDLGDGVGVLVLTSVFALTFARHASRPLHFVARLSHLAQSRISRLAHWRIRLGIDLRRRPPLPERMPALLAAPLAAILFALGLLWLLRAELPGGARDAVTRVSAAVWTALLAGLWAVLAASSLLLYSIPLIYADEFVRRWRRPRWRERALLWTGAAYLFLLVALAKLLPAWVPLVLILAVLGLYFAVALVPGGAPFLMVWKQVAPGSQPFALRWKSLTAAIQLGSVGLLVCLVLLARGDGLFGERQGATPITAFLGLALSWTFLGAYLVEVGHLGSVLSGGWLQNPGRPRRPCVHVSGASGRAERRRVALALGRAGFALAFAPRPPRSTQVQLTLEPGAQASGSDWPRRVDPAELASPRLAAALRRRAEIQCRRALRKGLKRVFRAAAAREFEKGSGFWVAPHQWFITHLSRDVDEDVLGHVGPRYSRVIPLAARHHAHVVLEALEIDLFFVEDGIRFPALRRVLAMVFEYYDIFGGQRLDDERHFAGLPGVRVLIHEYVLDEPFRSERYPEPEYEDLGRARILHVFRDRGADSEEVLAPSDTDWRPEPAAPELVLN